MTSATRKRRDEILSQLLERGHVTVKDVADHLNVSEATIRRDLRALADGGQMELVYGGAVLPRNHDFSVQAKSLRHAEGKRTIGQIAATLVRDDDQILIDSGTTAFSMAEHLRRRRMLGGHYRPDRADTVGPLALTALDQLRGYTAFIGVDGLSREFGLTASDIESAHLYRLAIRNAREAILLADHSKFQTPSLFKIVDWDPISRVVTDRMPSQEWVGFMAERGIDLLCPETLEHRTEPEEAAGD